MSDVYVSFGADTGGLEAGIAVVRAQISGMAHEMRDLAVEFVKTGAAADSELGQKIKALGHEMAEANAHFAEMGAARREALKKEEAGEEGGSFIKAIGEGLKAAVEPLNELKLGYAELIELYAEAFAVEKIVDWISETTEAAEKIENLAAKLGAPATQVSQLSAVARLTGADVNQLAEQMERLQLALARTGGRATPASEALRVLGINAGEFKRLGIAQQIDELAEAFSHFADGATKTAAAEALGKTFADQIPFLDKGKEGFKELGDAAQRTGAVLTNDTIEAFAKTREDINELSLAWSGFATRLYSVVNPAVDAAVRAMTKLLESANPAELRGYIEQFAVSLVGGEASIETFAIQAKAAWDKLVEDIKKSAGPIETGMQKVADGLNWLSNVGKPSPEWQMGYANFYNWLGLISDEQAKSWKKQIRDVYLAGKDTFGGLDVAGTKTQLTLQGINDRAKSAKEQIASLFSVGQARLGEYAGAGHEAGEGEKPAKPQVPQMNLARPASPGKIDKTDVKAYDDEVKDAQDAEKLIAATLDARLKDHLTTMTDWAKQTKDALHAEQAAIEAAADKALASAKLTSAQKLDIANKEKHELAAIALELQKTQAKAAEESAKAFDGAAEQIISALDGQIGGLLKGTTSWSTAFKNVLTSLTEDVIKFFLNWGLQSAEMLIKNQLVNAGILASTTATEAGTTAAHAAGAAAKKAVDATAVQGDAGRAAAGAYASTAEIPIIGPILAPAAAAAAYAGTVAFASFDVGSWQLPGDMTANLHKGEMIVPAAQTPWAQSLMANAAAGSGSGGGGDTYNHTTNMRGGFFDARGLSKALQRTLTGNPSLKPRYR